MLDLRFVRENQEAVAEAMENRHASWDAARFAELDAKRRAAIVGLDIVEINDYQTPNTSLADGSLAANFFQTPNYLAQQIADKGFDFVSIADVHIEPMGLYSSTITSVDQIPNDGFARVGSFAVFLRHGADF